MKEKRRVLVRGNGIDVGIDVHKESFHLTVRVKGLEVFHGSIPSRYEAVRRILDRFSGCRMKVGSEMAPFFCRAHLNRQLSTARFMVSRRFVDTHRPTYRLYGGLNFDTAI